jgi:hypothetical protein
MRMSLLLLVTVLQCAMIACIGGGDGGTDESPGGWDSVAESLGPGVVEGSPNPCQAGSPACFDILIAEMQQRADELTATCDHNALFATMYLRMTEEIQRAHDDGRFERPEATVNLTAWFAKHYFDAFDAWQDGDQDAVPRAWRIAFEAADERSVRGIGNLLLGMNAHVSRDLPYVVADVLDEVPPSIDPDYALVNQLIEDLSAEVIREVGERFDPSIRPAELPLALGGAPSFGALVTLWRSDSWQKGTAMVGSGESVADQVEFEATSRALALIPEVRYLPFVEGPEVRDAFCAEAAGN